MAHEVHKSSTSGLILSCVSLLMVGLGVPLVIRSLGPETYGVYALLFVFGNMNYLTGLGLNTALVKFLAEQGRSDESNVDVVTAFGVLAFLSLALLAAGMLAGNLMLSKLLGVPGPLLPEAGDLFPLLLASNVFLMTGQVFSAVLDSLQKVYVSNMMQVVYTVLYWGLLVLVVQLGQGLRAVGWVSLASAVAWFTLSGFAARSSWGPLACAISGRRVARSLRKQLGYGTKIYVSSTITQFNEPLMKVLLAQLIGVREVGYLDVALRIRNQLWGFAVRLVYPLYPLLALTKSRERLREIVLDAQQKILLFAIPASVFVVFAARPVIRLWIGDHVDPIALATAVIVPAYLLFSTTVTPFYYYLLAKDEPSMTIRIQAFNTAVSVVVFVSLFRLFGFVSAVLANAFAVVLSGLVLLVLLDRRFHLLAAGWAARVRDWAALAGVLVLTGLLLSLLHLSDVSSILLLSVSMLLLTILMLRGLGMVTPGDVQRYLGSTGLLSRWARWLFVPASPVPTHEDDAPSPASPAPGPASRPSLAIVMPVHDRREITLRCLRSICASDCEGLSLTCVVVDDASTDGTAAAIAAEFPDVRILRGDGDLWYTGGTNMGLQYALRLQADFVLAINDDIVFAPGAIKRLALSAMANPRSIVGALLVEEAASDRVFQVDFRWRTLKGGWCYGRDLTIHNVPQTIFPVQALAGNCVLYPRSVLEQEGLMNELHFKHVFSDVEYSCRLRRKGWRLMVDPQAKVYCHPNAAHVSLRSLPPAKILNTLFHDWRSQTHLPSVFRLNWSTAPSRLEGTVAFLIGMFRTGLRLVPGLRNLQ